MSAPQGTIVIYNADTTPPSPLCNGSVNPDGSFNVNTTGLPVGTYNVYAYYAGNPPDQPSQSANFQITVNPPNLPTTTTLAGVTPNPSSQGQAVAFTGTVTQP